MGEDNGVSEPRGVIIFLPYYWPIKVPEPQGESQ